MIRHWLVVVLGLNEVELILPGHLSSAVFYSAVPVKVGPEEGHENDQRIGIPLLCRDHERLGVQSGEKKVLGKPFSRDFIRKMEKGLQQQNKRQQFFIKRR